MIGRAGYLLKSGQANADKLLMLAFANKAKGEMQERLDTRLRPSLRGIRASQRREWLRATKVPEIDLCLQWRAKGGESGHWCGCYPYPEQSRDYRK